MSRMAVLGAGIVGRAAVWDLVRRDHHVIVADADADAARAAGRIFDVESRILDATDAEAITDLLAPIDLVVSAIPYRFGATVARAAVDTGTHYIDFGGNPTVVAHQLELDDAARDAAVTVVPDCGLAPGLADVLAMTDVAAIGGRADRVALRVGALPAEPIGALGYQLAFSPEGLINEYDEPCEVLRDGRRSHVEPLTGFEDVDFPGVGMLEAFHTAGGSSSLPRLLEGLVEVLDYKTLRYPGHGRVFAALRELGMFDGVADPATGIPPRTALVSALARNLPSGHPDLVLLRTEARMGGRIHGHTIVDRHDGVFSALARTTAFPATALANRIARGDTEPGARTMDAAIDGPTLMADLASVGIRAT